MKTIGIIGALEEEIVFLKESSEIVAAKNIVSTDFYMGKMAGQSVVIVRCGVGKVNAAVCTQALIDMYGVDYVVNIGVAGGINPILKVCDTVISSDLAQHDFDSTGFGYEIGIIPRNDESFFKADPKLIELALEGAKSIQNHNTYLGRIATGDQFVHDTMLKSSILKKFDPYCVDMESAAIAQTCYLNKIPFVVVRSISDTANQNAMDDFSEYVNIAAKNANTIVEHIVRNIS